MENAVWVARTGARDLSAAARALLARALGLPSPRASKRTRGESPFCRISREFKSASPTRVARWRSHSRSIDCP